MEHKERINKLNTLETMLKELESSKIQYDVKSILEELKEKYDDMRDSDMSVQTHPNNNWDSESSSIVELIEIIHDIDVREKNKNITFFTENTIKRPEKRAEAITFVKNQFMDIGKKVELIEVLKEELEIDYERIIENTEDKSASKLQDAHDSAVDEQNELDSFNWDVFEKYKNVIRLLDDVENGIC